MLKALVMGMAIHAFVVSILSGLDLITPSAEQQLIAGLIFSCIAAAMREETP